MAFSGTGNANPANNNILLTANNAASPAFGTLFSTTNGTAPVAIAHTNINTLGVGGAASDGLEQSVWNKSTGTFFISVPAFNGDQGGVQEIKTDGTLGRTYKFASMAGGPATCGPTGLAIGASGDLMVGCGSGQAVLLNPAGAGSIVALFPQISGTDEIWYDPTLGDYFVTGHNSAGDRVFDVISDATDLILQSVLLPVSSLSNPHSITVDEATGDVFVALAGSTPTVPNPTCPLGCVAVFAQEVPEPGTLPIFAIALLGMVGASIWRRRKSLLSP
jgi:DNA-binding beta-propeller fold protein YncE